MFKRGLISSTATAMIGLAALVFTFVGCGNGGSASIGSQGGGEETNESAFTLKCEEVRFFTLINLYRQNAGFATLAISQGATEAARWHARDMGESAYFSHTDSLGRDPSSRVADFGYSGTAGENAAAGNATAIGTFCQWKNSAGHNANMLRPEFRVIGIGTETVQSSQYGSYWSTPFGFSMVDDDGSPAVTSPRIENGTCQLPTSVPSC
ncbi:MAG: CAP domain-containing protein [Bdellovibrionales bacterium]|jgi:uncharacterized protein YkwD|nr:CAP domain-containing protein [Bdellovibrionales bacterium]